ncbi:MAG: NrfD/PsrC family molybdoenzyme membrane anchor subunit [Solirubrobacteraceae bacterium]
MVDAAGREARGRDRRAEGAGASYYGLPVLNAPVWAELDIAGYLFLGGLAGASSVLAAGAELSGRAGLARPAKLGALAAISLSLVALIHDLGRPERFLNMLRVFKVTSPMSVGTWILSAYAPLAGLAAASEASGRTRRVGRAATLGAAALGPAVASYTAALVANTAVPVWHDGHRELPFVFVGSAATAAAGLGLVAAPVAEAGPARRLAVLGAAVELAASRLMEDRMGTVAEPLREGRAGALLRASRALTVIGAVAGAVAGRRSRAASVAAGGALLAGSACTRFGIFAAGMASAGDPAQTVGPQRACAAQRPEGR